MCRSAFMIFFCEQIKRSQISYLGYKSNLEKVADKTTENVVFIYTKCVHWLYVPGARYFHMGDLSLQDRQPGDA